MFIVSIVILYVYEKRIKLFDYTWLLKFYY